MKFLGELDDVSLGRTQRCNRRLTDPNRLQAIRDTGLLDTPREETFDRLARLAAELLDVPLTIMSLVDADKQFFKADFGLPSPFRETRTLPIDASLCRYTLEGDPIISSNALNDPFLKFHPSTGPWGIVAIIVLPLINPDGHVLGTFCCIEPKVREWTPRDLKVMRELTTSIMTEINLRNQIQKLKTEQNLRETFVAALTHDLRTPLTASKLSVQLLGRRHADLPSVQTSVARVSASLDRAERMIQNLLDASRIKAGKRVALDLGECDLHAITTQALEELAAVYTERFVLKAEGVFKMKADPLGLRRIVENLASNAAKYGAPGTPIEVLLAQSGNRVTLQVRNQGTPIAEHEQQTIFEPFHRTRSASESAEKGWGLGLPLVRGLAEAHGGSATVTSSAEDGTCFTIILPLEATSREPHATLADFARIEAKEFTGFRS
ncbi:GAF domain-containing protein [Corallococcus praedator]|uniref:histidine kinase n=1 Tax=Corallococcus praedator TaxID=2316724 RepID=A0ABX9QPT5_9BACT|nr:MULTISPECIES: GAF domain-containing sensor histidine kinase [Corallococcus]RKH19227.1 GAF domain-containing protein [Corallococcus sp. CA047B]RKH33701.1 GAF domain-containing protein [Corallococcus sp. CA031C]RKI14901.1 GAF domain-containing protein [Corallococcus praedator]